MKKLIVLLCLVFIQACAQQKIFIATQHHGSPEQRLLLEQQLTHQGHSVVKADIALGATNTYPVILYPPTVQDFKLIQDVETALKSIGYKEVLLRSFNFYKHVYTKNNIGVYLPYQNKFKIPAVMQSEECGGQYAILDATNNVIKIEIGNHPENLHTVQGKAEFITETKGKIVTHSKVLPFTFQQTTRDTYLGNKSAQLLSIYSEANSVLPETCTFIVIYE
ncbi:hypothetical protein [Shewanella gaetbuli]